MNILINFSSLKSGGGQNVQLNFLSSIGRANTKDITLVFFVAADSEAYEYLKEKNYTYYILPRNPIKRIIYEIFLSRRILRKNKIDIIYTYFGYGFFPKKYKQVIGSAYSNLFEPEIDFWKHYGLLVRLIKASIDFYRLYGVKKADAVIFETKYVENKARNLLKLENTVVIAPSITVPEVNEDFIMPSNILKKIKCLFLCGWHKNKNTEIIPKLAKHFKVKKINIHFILTAPDDGSTPCLKFMKKLEELGVEDMVSVVGNVNKKYFKDLYSKVDFIFLLSRLESFSNNIIEAWRFSRPLVISDEEWSREICKDAAYYVERNSKDNIVNNVIELIENDSLRKSIIQNGTNQLKNYPSTERRIDAELNFIKRINEIN